MCYNFFTAIKNIMLEANKVIAVLFFMQVGMRRETILFLFCDFALLCCFDFNSSFICCDVELCCYEEK